MNRVSDTSTRVLTPPLPPTPDPSSPSSTHKAVSTPTELKIIHLNCHLRLDVTEHIITQSQYDVIALQEPHINAHTLRPLTHPAWNLFLSYDYHPKD